MNPRPRFITMFKGFNLQTYCVISAANVYNLNYLSLNEPKGKLNSALGNWDKE